MKRLISFELNGDHIETEAESSWTLLHLIREILGLTGTKEGCSMGECGACTVIPHPSIDEIKTAIEGNLCRCGGYLQVVKAIKTASESVRVEEG